VTIAFSTWAFRYNKASGPKCVQSGGRKPACKSPLAANASYTRMTGTLYSRSKGSTTSSMAWAGNTSQLLVFFASAVTFPLRIAGVRATHAQQAALAGQDRAAGLHQPFAVMGYCWGVPSRQSRRGRRLASVEVTASSKSRTMCNRAGLPVVEKVCWKCRP